MSKFTTIAKFRPGAPFVEAYGLLLASLTLGRNGGSPPRTIAVAAANRGTGTTTTVINLGMMMARAGRQCLLIDANWRNPALHRAFGLPVTPGFADVIGRNKQSIEVIRVTNIPNLALIPAGKLDVPPHALLDTQRIAAKVGELREQFEFILLDTPAVTKFPDALTLARAVDGVLLVVPTGATSGRAHQEARRRLERVDAKILGAILNRVSREEMAELSS